MKVSFFYLGIAPAALRPFCSTTDAYLILPFVNQANPDIVKHALAQESVLLKIHLDIGQEVNVKNGKRILAGDRLGIDGLTVELNGRKEPDYEHPKLPGADGPNPRLSSGAKSMDLVHAGKFVDLSGSRSVSLEDGAWEMVWRNHAKAGALICGFDVPGDIERNGASIPKGKLYMTFPLYSQETLQNLRESKLKAEEKAVEAMDRAKDAQARFAKETNLLAKAMHFRDAMKAHEDVEYSGYNSYSRMPIERDMIELLGGLRLCNLGTVWTKKSNGFFGSNHVLLGSATVSQGTLDELQKKATADTERKSVGLGNGLVPGESLHP